MIQTALKVLTPVVFVAIGTKYATATTCEDGVAKVAPVTHAISSGKKF